MPEQRKFIEVRDSRGDQMVCYIADDGVFAATYLEEKGDSVSWFDTFIPHWRRIDAELRASPITIMPNTTPSPCSRADDVALVSRIAGMFAVYFTPESFPLAVEKARLLIRETERIIGAHHANTDV